MLKMIRWYQYGFSGFTHLIAGLVGLREAGCRFSPRCSEYTSQALTKYGFWKGLLLGVKRILRCHPGSEGGWDPVR